MKMSDPWRDLLAGFKRTQTSNLYICCMKVAYILYFRFFISHMIIANLSFLLNCQQGNTESWWNINHTKILKRKLYIFHLRTKNSLQLLHLFQQQRCLCQWKWKSVENRLPIGAVEIHFYICIFPVQNTMPQSWINDIFKIHYTVNMTLVVL